MRLEQLQYFMEIAHSKSISIAAENLYISQSALSRAVKVLEDELGVTLLVRSADGVQLTKAGESLLSPMQVILEKTQELFNVAAQYNITSISTSSQIHAKLNISTLPVIADSLFSPFMEIFYKNFPYVDLTIQVLNENDYLTLPDPSTYDLFISSNVNELLDKAIADSQQNENIIFNEKFSVIVNSLHPLAEKKSLYTTDVFDYKLVVHDNGFSPETLYRYFLQSEQHLNICLKSNNPRVIKQLIQNHNAVLFTNNILVQKDYRNDPSLKIIPLRNIHGTCFALYSPHHSQLFLLQQIIDLLKVTRAQLS